jgi:putative FmdB family regulatory protein
MPHFWYKKGLHKLHERTIAMPIYEFRCLKCDEVFEILMMKTQDEVEAKCPHCASEDFERVLSTTSHAMGFSKGEARGPTVQSRECGSGTCSTVTLPGHTKS